MDPLHSSEINHSRFGHGRPVPDIPHALVTVPSASERLPQPPDCIALPEAR